MREEIIIETIEEGKYQTEIVIDEFAENPREWDNLGKMLCFHKRYDLGDKTDLTADMFSSWEEIHDYIVKEYDAVIVLPIYMYDHSGITISVSPFGCRWDSGQIGYIYATKQDIIKEYGKCTTKTVNIAREVLLGEIKTYDSYLRGDVYGYVVYEIKECNLGCEHKINVDACFGYYDIDDARKEAKSIMERCLKEVC